jgi:hypothetical protein
MANIRFPHTITAALLTCVTVVSAAMLTSGCGGTQQTSTAPPAGAQVPAVSTPAAPSATTQQAPAVNAPPAAVPNRGGRGGSVTGPAGAAGLPADWPTDVPIPAGTIGGSTGSAGRWSILVIAAGSAADVRRSAVALYSAAGFTAVTDSVLNKGNRQVTLVAENRDHSTTQTNLVVGVTTR